MLGRAFPGDLVVKDLALSLLWLRFYPYPGMPRARPEKNAGQLGMMIIFSSYV